MNNFREIEIKPDCCDCIHFYSYELIYEDPLEPDYCGTCDKKSCEMVGEGNICDLFKNKIS